MLGVHGWSGDHRTFSPLADSLPPLFSFWSVDLPGCGRSPAPREWTLAGITHDLVQTIGSIGAPVHVLGNCSGALLALSAAKAMNSGGNYISQISMIDAFAWWPWYFRLFLAPYWGRYAYWTAFANPIGRWMTNRSLANRRSRDTDLTEGFSRVDHATTYKYLQLLSAIEGPEEFQGISCPIDIYYGERSFAAVRESASRWLRVFPHARTTVLRGAGHLPIAEATAQLRYLIFEENPCLDASTNCAR